MNIEEINFLSSIYKNKVVPFWYYRDKYAVQLLTYAIEEKVKISALKASNKQFLLQKAPLKEITARLSGNQLSKSDLTNYLPKAWQHFNLTFHRWGGYEKYHKHSWYQTTRPGFSFVIQLNFEAEHDALYHKLIAPIPNQTPLFKTNGHPVSRKKMRLTLAWARLDLDLATGEVLIEEIQTDWIREVDSLVNRFKDSYKKREKEKIRDCWLRHYADTSLHNLKTYQNYIAVYKKTWAEAIMSATFDFCVTELGIRNIYFHTYESGKTLKDCNPPKSLYAKLPKKFGFVKTKEAPKFIQADKKIRKKIRKHGFWWWQLLL